MSAARSSLHAPVTFIAALFLGLSFWTSAGLAQEAEADREQSERCPAGADEADCGDAESTQEGRHESGNVDTGLSSEEPDGAGASAAGD